MALDCSYGLVSMGGKKGGSSKGGAANKHKAGGACTEDDPTSSQYRVNACIVLAENFDEGCQIETLFGGGSEADRIAGNSHTREQH